MLTVRFFAAAKAAFGSPELIVDDAGDASIDELLAVAASAAQGRSAGDASRVFARCSFLVDGVATRDLTHRLGDARSLDVLPPFAGG